MRWVFFFWLVSFSRNWELERACLLAQLDKLQSKSRNTHDPISWTSSLFALILTQEDSAVGNIHYSPQLYGPYLSRFLEIPFQQVPWETSVRARPKTQCGEKWFLLMNWEVDFI
jgi:hypothetical protein